MLHIDAEISGVPKLAFLDGTPKRLFIDGKWVEARSGKTFTSFNPATAMRKSACPICGQRSISIVANWKTIRTPRFLAMSMVT